MSDEEISESGDAKKQCFVICPIGDEGSEARIRSDQVMKHIVRPSIEPLGYEAKRADHIDVAGLITHQIMSTLMSAEITIADLTDHNPNVFYELAIRHAFRKPCIQIAQVGTKLPFDVGGARTIFYDLTLDKAEEAKAAIAKQIKGSEVGEPMETPISFAIKALPAPSESKQKPIKNEQIMHQIVSLRGDIQRTLNSITEIDKKIASIQNFEARLAQIYEHISKPASGDDVTTRLEEIRKMCDQLILDLKTVREGSLTESAER